MLSTAVDRVISSDPETPTGDAAVEPEPTRSFADSAAKPFDLEFVSISRRELIELKMQANQYRSLHASAPERIKWVQLRHDHEMVKALEQIGQLEVAPRICTAR